MYRLFTLYIFSTIILLTVGCDFNRYEKFKGSWIGMTAATRTPNELIILSVDSANVYLRLLHADTELTVPISEAIVHGEINLTFPDIQTQVTLQYITGRLSGNINIAGKNLPCELVQTTAMSISQITDLIGIYDLGDEHVLQIDPYIIDAHIACISVLDFQSGKKRIAFPVNDSVFNAGDQMIHPVTTDFSISFTRNAQKEIVSIALTGKDGQRKDGKKLADLPEAFDLIAKNGAVSLAGTLRLPVGNMRKHPVVVFVPDAGDQHRGNLPADFITLLPYYGIATFVYDKRGCGESSGNYLQASFNDQAQDLQAVIAQLRRQPELDDANIHAIGVNQAGLVMSIAAQSNNTLRSFAMIGTPIKSLQEQELEACASRMQADMIPASQAEQALAYQRNLFAYLKGNVDLAALTAEYAAIENLPTAQYVTSAKRADYLAWWQKNYNYNIHDYLHNSTTPMFALYGARDVLCAAKANAEMFTALTADNKGSKAVVYPSANHYLLLGERAGGMAFEQIEGYAVGSLQDIVHWFGQQSGLKK